MFNISGIGNKKDRIKILIVDDKPNIVMALRDRLEEKEYSVIFACNGKEGLERAALELPDIILADVVMPVMDGLEMLEVLRRTPGCQSIPVIMLTASSRPEDIARANECGIEDYIVKPYTVNYLVEKIESIVEQQISCQ